jgi:hypothetical protein
MGDYMKTKTVDEIMQMLDLFAQYYSFDKDSLATHAAKQQVRSALQQAIKLERMNYAGCMIELEELEAKQAKQHLVAEVVNGVLRWYIPADRMHVPEWLHSGKHLLYAEKP